MVHIGVSCTVVHERKNYEVVTWGVGQLITVDVAESLRVRMLVALAQLREKFHQTGKSDDRDLTLGTLVRSEADLPSPR